MFVLSKKAGNTLLPCARKDHPCGDEQPKAHTPEMAHDARCAENATAYQHANSPRGSKQTHRTHKKVHPTGNPRILTPFGYARLLTR
jgi:hypothetical protein